MRKERKHYTAEEKVAILRRHLLEKVPVSDLCEELALQPTVFYRWQKEFFENGAAAFQTPERPRHQAEEKQKRIEFLEKKRGAKPRIISDNGPQFIARDFKEFIRISGMTHVRTSPFYPQSNGKIERWHKSLKRECIRPLTPLTLEDARRLIQIYVDHYNTVRLHSAIGYVTPQDRLAGRQAEIHAARDRKLEEARSQRQLRRQQTMSSRFAPGAVTMTSPGETEAGSAGTQPC
ncbi:MAG: integrase core domain-containing protein [Terriglobales bacterium]